MHNCAGRLDKHTQNPEDDLPWEDVAEFREGDCDEAHVLSVSWRSAANQSIGEDMIMIRIMDRLNSVKNTNFGLDNKKLFLMH